MVDLSHSLTSSPVVAACFIIVLTGRPSCSGSELDSSSLSYYDYTFEYRYDEAGALELLDYFNENAQQYFGDYYRAYFNYRTNMTEYNAQLMSEAGWPLMTLQGNISMEFMTFNATGFSRSTQRRLDAFKNMNQNLGTYDPMSNRYTSAKVCMSDDVCLALQPDLTRIMAKSRNYDELYWAWNEWRAVAGQPSRQDFIKYVENMNSMTYFDYPDAGALMRSKYQVEDLEKLVIRLYSQLEKLYKHLHAYVRRKLYTFYGPEYINLKGPLPAHLLGDMWAQQWTNIFDIVDPYPRNTTLDITQIIKEKKLKPIDFYRYAEEFFTSLGMKKAPQSFWEESMFEKPTDGRKVGCHASAWDFRNEEDFRISMCGDTTFVDFRIAHHEMGHIQYYMQYADHPVEFRSGANPAFDEAVGDTVTLSVATPKHLETIGLIPQTAENNESDIGFLMMQALDKVAYLPFTLLVDLWRWEAFDERTRPDHYNKRWWDLRFQYQGVIPPTPRTEEHFDPAAKYHISASVPYVRYFLSTVIQFQFHKALCNASGHVGPLFKCDIYRSKEAGKLFSNMLKLGWSEHWTVAMETITGQTEMRADAMLEYFQPLLEWLEKENKDETIGWGEIDDWRPKPPDAWYSTSEAFRHTQNTSYVLIMLTLGLLLLFAYS